MSILESGFPQVHLARLNPITCASTESGPVESGRREDAEPVSKPPQTSEPIASGSGSHHPDSSPQLRREDLDPLSDPENWELLDEEVVFAECHDLVESDLIQPGCSVDFVEIESERPIVQIGPAVFEGCYEDVVGTIVCIEVNKADQRNKTNSLRGPLGPPSSKCQHENQHAHSIPLLKTFKRLNLSRVFLKPRCES